MAERFNVAQRLAEGRPAVEHTQSYVWACHVLGYQHPDLTGYASQVRDWYDSEDGLDLGVLDDDCAKLRAAANAADEALSRQREQLAELSTAWTGSGAGSATEFLQRHCRTGEAVTAGVRGAAERCAALRDDLWQLIDAKAATAVAIDDRRLAERPGWLAAAQTVTSGGGDRSAADELVEKQVEPYVDNDIRADWLAAMRSTAASVDAGLDAVTDAVAAAPAVRFEIPGDLAPRPFPLDDPQAPNVDEVPVPVVPASAGATPRADPAPATSNAEVPTPPLMNDPLSAGLGDLGSPSSPSLGGLGGLGSGIGGVISQIFDGISGLLESLADGPADASITDDAPLDDDPDVVDPDDQPEEETVDESEDDAGPTAAEPGEPETPPENPPAPDPAVKPPAEELAAPAAQPTPSADAPPAEPSAAPPGPTPDERTPCEIAADELPQAGQ